MTLLYAYTGTARSSSNRNFYTIMQTSYVIMYCAVRFYAYKPNRN